MFFFAEDGNKSGQWDSGGGDEASICVSLLQASHLCEALNPDFLSIQDTGCPEIFEGVNCVNSFTEEVQQQEKWACWR